MLTTVALPAFGLSIDAPESEASPVFRASFGGCGCASAEVGEAPASGASSGATSSQADKAPTVDLAVSLIVGAVVLLLIAAA